MGQWLGSHSGRGQDQGQGQGQGQSQCLGKLKIGLHCEELIVSCVITSQPTEEGLRYITIGIKVHYYRDQGTLL